MAKKVSKAGSVEGYSFKKWFKGTKTSFKAVVMAGIAVGAFYLFPETMAESMKAVLSAVYAAAGKWLMDLIDFWLSDIEV